MGPRRGAGGGSHSNTCANLGCLCVHNKHKSWALGSEENSGSRSGDLNIRSGDGKSVGLHRWGLEVGRMEWKTRVQTQALGKSWAGLEEDVGASNPEMGGFSS